MRSCGYFVYSLWKIGSKVCGRLFTGVLQNRSTHLPLRGQLPVSHFYPIILPLVLSTAISTKLHLLINSFTHNPQSLLLQPPKRIKER